MGSHNDLRTAPPEMRRSRLAGEVEDHLKDSSWVALDSKQRRRLQMRLGQRAFRRRQKLETALHAVEDQLAQYLSKSAVETSCPVSIETKHSEPSGPAQSSSRGPDLPWGSIDVLRSNIGQKSSTLLPFRVLKGPVSLPSSTSDQLTQASFSRSTISSSSTKRVSRSDRDRRDNSRTASSSIASYVPPVLEEIPDIDYWTGLASTFVDSLGPDAPVLRTTSTSPSPPPKTKQDTSIRSEAASRGFDVVLTLLEAKVLAAHPQEAAQVAASNGGRFLFDKPLPNLEKLGLYKTFRSSIDTTFNNIGLDELSIYRAGTDTAAHLLKIHPRHFRPGAVRTISVFFNWPDRIGKPVPCPEHIPDPLAPTEEMLDCKPIDLQVTQIHHYWVDLIPWPGTRRNILQCADRLANFDEFELGYDFFLGIRWHGGIPWDGRNYEVSDTFYLKWGWILDGYAISTTDYWRRKRGLRGIRSVGRVGAVALEGSAGKRKLYLDDPEMWGGKAILHLVNSCDPGVAFDEADC